MPEHAPRTYRVKHGGLMRCCLASLDLTMLDRDKHYPAGEPLAVEGETLGCRYHSDPNSAVMIFRDGAWQWGGSHRA